MDTNATGRFIAELRKQKGFTQKELADKMMVTDKAISRWETGKGLPDTSLLKPLCDILGISVGELLSGRVIEEAQMKEQTDKIILDSLNYSKRMLASTVRIVLHMIGAALIVSPLYLPTTGYYWILGVVIMAVAIALTVIHRKGYSMKLSNKVCAVLAIVSQAAALVLEILPLGAVMVFASDPSERTVEVYSYFSLLPLGYANFSPMITGVLTGVIVLLSVITLFPVSKAAKYRNAAFICSILALAFSLIPLLMFGNIGMTMVSYVISALLAVSICLQAVANRKN